MYEKVHDVDVQNERPNYVVVHAELVLFSTCDQLSVIDEVERVDDHEAESNDARGKWACYEYAHNDKHQGGREQNEDEAGPGSEVSLGSESIDCQGNGHA